MSEKKPNWAFKKIGLHLAEIASLECDALVQKGFSFQGTFLSNFSVIYSHYNVMFYPSGLEVTWSKKPMVKRYILIHTLQGHVRVLVNG